MGGRWHRQDGAGRYSRRACSLHAPSHTCALALVPIMHVLPLPPSPLPLPLPSPMPSHHLMHIALALTITVAITAPLVLSSTCAIAILHMQHTCIISYMHP